VPSKAVHGQDVRGQTGTKASSVTIDTTPPALLRHTLLRDTGVVYLFFDDAVNIDSFNTTDITLQVAAPGATAVQLNCTTAQRNRGSLREVALNLAAPCLYANGTASGAASDWTVLQQAGLKVTATLVTQPLLLDAADGLVQDYAVPARDSPAVTALSEAGPNCQVSTAFCIQRRCFIIGVVHFSSCVEAIASAGSVTPVWLLLWCSSIVCLHLVFTIAEVYS
jgi:hypothetical protein